MTRIIETVMVEVWCSHRAMEPPRNRCRAEAQATIVSTVERGDLILGPVDWQTRMFGGQIEFACPKHKEKK